MVAYTLFFIGQALSQNIATLLITRFWGGFFGVAPLTIAGGIIADMWSAEGRGPATSLFAASTFLGPVLGPIVGGFVAESDLKWNWIFWIMMMFAGACTALTIAFIPETYAPIILLNKVRYNGLLLFTMVLHSDQSILPDQEPTQRKPRNLHQLSR